VPASGAPGPGVPGAPGGANRGNGNPGGPNHGAGNPGNENPGGGNPGGPGDADAPAPNRFQSARTNFFERAESEQDELEKRRLLNFVVIGGGPTGVELAGAIAELAKRALAKDFRTIDPRCARIFLVEAGPRLLGTFDPSLSQKAQKALERLGVEVRVGQAVTHCDPRGARVGSEEISAATIVWAAGVMASPAGAWLGVPTDRAGRVVVGPDFSVPSHPEIFVIGDTAAARDASGKPLPGVAPVAKQQGQYVASLLLARWRGQAERPFRYRDFGSLATIGRKLAVAQLGQLRLSGFAAWLLWSIAHVYFLIGFRSRMVVALTWLWNYLTLERGTRLITGHVEQESRPRPENVARIYPTRIENA